MNNRVFDPDANATWQRKRKGLGASDVPAILGIDRFSDRQKVYDRLVALLDHDILLDEEISPDAARGMLLEDVCAELYAHQTQRPVRDIGNTTHDDYAWFSVTPDRFVPNFAEFPAALVELKVMRSWTIDRLLQAGQPEPSHVVQCQMQMLVTGTHLCHLFMWAPESMKQFLIPIEFDQEKADEYMLATRHFWEDNVLLRVRPAGEIVDTGPPDLSAAMVRLEDASLEAKCYVMNRLRGGSKAAGTISDGLKKMIVDEVLQHATSKVQVGGFTVSVPWVSTMKLDKGALDAFLMEHGRRLDSFKVSSGGHHRLSITGEASQAITELSDNQLNQLAESTEQEHDDGF